MANIYSYAPEAWTYSNVTRLSSNSFRFDGVGSYATSVITGEEIGELGGELLFRGFISPIQKNLTEGLRCRLEIYSKQGAEQQDWAVEKHFVYLKGDRNGAVNQKITTYSGSFDHIDLRLEVLQDGQLSLNNTIDLTSFVIGNASSTSIGNIEEEINAALPFLVYDINKREQSNNASDAEVYVGMIPINMRRDMVDADAGFRTNISVDSDGVLTERFYRDGIEELLSPVITDLTAGRHIITDDHAYLSVPKGSHTYLATLQFEGGTMDIDTRKTLYTIETSRAGMKDIAIEGNILDMAFSGVEQKYMPDEVWLMVQSIGSGQIHIQHGTYNPETQSISFQNDIEYLEEVVNGAIEFDGYWKKSGVDKNKKKFISVGKPKVLLQREDGSLKYGNYDSPDVPLLTIQPSGVVDCSMILGWNFQSATEVSNDMGMVVAYIKDDGKAYYRTITNGAMDVNPFPLNFSGAVTPLQEIRTFRTNDYRVGFTVTDKVNNLYTILTERYWQGDSVESIYLESAFDQDSVTDYTIEDSPVPTEMIAILNPEDNNNIKIHFNEKLMQGLGEITGLLFSDDANTEFSITSATVDENIPALLNVNIAYNPNLPTVEDEMVLFPNGITGFTPPMMVSITSTNLKDERTVYSLYNQSVNVDIPDGSMEATDLVDREGTPTVIPRYNFLKSTFGRENVSLAYEMTEYAEFTTSGDYGKTHFLKSSYGNSNVSFVPELTELLMVVAHDDDALLTAEFSADNVSFAYQAYTVNGIPV